MVRRRGRCSRHRRDRRARRDRAAVRAAGLAVVRRGRRPGLPRVAALRGRRRRALAAARGRRRDPDRDRDLRPGDPRRSANCSRAPTLARILRDSGCAHPVAAAAGYHEPSLVFLAGTATRLTDGAGAAEFLRGGRLPLRLRRGAPGAQLRAARRSHRLALYAPVRASRRSISAPDGRSPSPSIAREGRHEREPAGSKQAVGGPPRGRNGCAPTSRDTLAPARSQPRSAARSPWLAPLRARGRGDGRHRRPRSQIDGCSSMPGQSVWCRACRNG